MAAARDLRREVAADLAAVDTLTADVLAALERVPDSLARRLADALGLDPDTIAPPDGDDGDDVVNGRGATYIETELAAQTTDPARRAALMRATREDWLDLVDAAGVRRARLAYVSGALKLAGDDADDDLVAEWIRGEADDALSGYEYTAARDVSRTLRTWALASLTGPADLSGALRGVRERAGARNADSVEASLAAARMLRVVQDVRRAALEADGREVLIAYVGPDDAKTRPFCDALVGRAFTVAQLAKADNAQTPGPARVDCGGFNCRHVCKAVDADDVADLGLAVGTDTDIERANKAARRGRK